MWYAYAPPSSRLDSSLSLPLFLSNPWQEGSPLAVHPLSPSLSLSHSSRLSRSLPHTIFDGSMVIRQPSAAWRERRRYSNSAAQSELGFTQSTTVCHETSISSVLPRLSLPLLPSFSRLGDRKQLPPPPAPDAVDADAATIATTTTTVAAATTTITTTTVTATDDRRDARSLNVRLVRTSSSSSSPGAPRTHTLFFQASSPPRSTLASFFVHRAAV